MSVFPSIFCFLSTFFIIQLAPPFYGLPRITFQVGLIAAILTVILSLCTGKQVHEGINNILIVFISQVLMAVIHGRINARKIYVYFYFLPTTIAQTPPLSTPTCCTSKRKSKRRCKRVKKSAAIEDLGGEKPLSPIPTTPSPPATSSLIVFRDTILGYGTNKTVVYEGSFQGRAAAVRRYLQDHVSLATREVSLLHQSDSHPNVTRYYYQESGSKYFYIAFELCPGSLADFIEKVQDDHEATEVEDKRREGWEKIARDFDAKKAMKQIASGLRHLHGLGLVHRDIKPQNILISPSSSPRGGYRLLLSDFGLCKKLGVDRSSFLPNTYGVIAPGTAGWRAPEMLLYGEDELDTLTTDDDTDTTIKSSSVTKSVDIFALGCLFYYILTKGGHPYGNCSGREANIIKENKDLSLLYSDEEAHDLITHMLHRQPSQRPDIETCLLHPFFWTPAKRLEFLGDASDRFEIMCTGRTHKVLVRLERDAKSIVGADWHQTLDQTLVKNLRQSRKYDGSSIRDLLRALRNKNNQYQDLPDDVKFQLGPMPEGFLTYFTDRYPRLLIYVHEVVKDTGLYRELTFKMYFELPEP